MGADSGLRCADLALSFPGTAQASTELVGGKGHSLITLTAQGFDVPPGVVLTSQFFAPWVDSMLASAEWLSLQDAPAENLHALCERLKQQALELHFGDVQRHALDTLTEQLALTTTGGLYAVRSSSPQEDLQAASFAGGYESFLGVSAAGLAEAIRGCFASAFDERVIAYKRARGLCLNATGMAVVVQQQLASDVAGVAFSINPLNNDFDQLVVDANWGLGETVVAGLVTPDHWVVCKDTSTVLESAIQRKSLSRWLGADGSIIDRDDHRPAEPCLTPAELQRLVSLVKQVENRFGYPLDIEWALAGGMLYLLQARPITTFVPLPAELISAPGLRRRLYMDVALSSGFTINAPISRMGLDVFRRLVSRMARFAFGPMTLNSGPSDALVVMAGGRMYLDFSNVLWVSSPHRMAHSMCLGDALMAQIVGNVDPAQYKSLTRPAWARLRMLLRLPGSLWRVRQVLAHTLVPFIAPSWMGRRVAQQLQHFERQCAAETDNTLPLEDWWQRYVGELLPRLLNVSLPVVAPATLAAQAFVHQARRTLGDEHDLLDRLDHGFEGNVVVAMSIEMHALAGLLETDDRKDPERLLQRLQGRQLPAAFMQAWDHFVSQYGCRGPLEMDVGHPRYADAPLLALRQIASMPEADQGMNPKLASSRQVQRRREATAIVIKRAGPIRRRVLQHLLRIAEAFAGWRDTPKLHLLLLLHRLRKRLILEGEQLQQQGRLDHPEQVFDLDFDDISAARTNPAMDLRQLCAERRHAHEQLAAQVINFPPMIDSRGRILQPPPGDHRDGEFRGTGLSRGIVRGPARTLRSPHEKALLPGEILIAYTTDPGWTPIFANAAAVVLEIGGVLQHGAVVARELGLPCVAGIAGISRAVEDGRMIEVDGASGIVRLLPPDAEQAQVTKHQV